MIRACRDTVPSLVRQRGSSGLVGVVPDDAASGVDFAGLDGHLAVVFELVHGFLGGVEVAEEKPEQSRCDDGRDADTGWIPKKRQGAGVSRLFYHEA